MTPRKIGWALFWCAFLASIALESGELSSWDAANRLQVTRWIWTAEPQVRDQNGWFGIYGRNHEKFAWYGLGQSLWMSPAYLLASRVAPLVSADRTRAEKIEETLVTYLTFPLTAALALTALFALLLRLDFDAAVAGLSSLAAFWCTSLLPYTQTKQENSLLLLCTLTSMWAVAAGVKTGRYKWWALAGFAAGFGLLTRLTFVFDVGAVTLLGAGLIFFTGQKAWRLDWRYWMPRVMVAGLVCSVFVLVDRIYQFYRFESWTSTYYDIIFAQRSDVVAPGDIRIGFPALAWSVKYNIWQFDPLALLGLIAVPVWWRSLNWGARSFGVIAALLLAVYLVFYSSTHDQFDGAAAWGCRYVTTPMVLLGAFGVAATLSCRHRLRPWFCRFALVLAAVALAVQLLSTVLWYNLEEKQQIEHLGASESMVVLRAQNAAALATGRWKEWNLLPSGDSKRLRTPNFFPFLAAKYLPKNARLTLELLWAVIAVTTLALNLKLFLKLRAELATQSSWQHSPVVSG
ncbi:MAG: hypothetical protein FGM15_10435 [Chthoniobacterales bacterium]|nr:hypothetical protein [Chthoniobacterales bacterium]